MKTRILATVCFIVAAAAPIVAQERDTRDNPLAAARDLYASARYDEALAVLNGMRPEDTAPERKSIEQYRSLCLLALGRGTEAETAIAAVVTVDPLFQPTESDASPRVRAAFSDVRQRLLPDIATSRYAAAKAAFDRKEFAAAEQQFRALVLLLDDPQMAGRLGDMRTLAAGFVDLAKAAAAPPPEPKPEPTRSRSRHLFERRYRCRAAGGDSAGTSARAAVGDGAGPRSRSPGTRHR
jgi:tetratricopeptide (TPR) repeat protein